MSKPTKLAEKNITPEKRSLRVMVSVYERPLAEKISKKPAPENERRVAKEGLKRKRGEIEVMESKKPKSAVEEKISEVEEVFHNIVMRLTDHSGMGDALWFEVGEDLGRFSINEFCLITGMKYVGSTHLASVVDNRLITRYFLPLRGVSREHLELQLSNANFDNDDDAVKLSIETRAAICNAVENKLSSKRRTLKKYDKVHYSIVGFPHALLVWAYESLPTIAAKFTTKYVEAIMRMLSWTSVDNVKFDDVMSAFTAKEEKQPKCFVVMPTEEELKDSCAAQLYLKNPNVVPQLPRKIPVTQPSTDTSPEWQEF
ncbi:hypothetical protein TIFTF001_033806 [Ficus carica]|uniref:DUF1985 domain-containing protein n=1 Tax=Ficus carica TaxID=3494 RepID=A0AA88DZD2_FICCA|nr:hypothetical protein TIFTF001_033806 [Ficus carica]